MRVYLGPFHRYIGPYQIVDGIFFWHEEYPNKDISKRWDYRLHDSITKWLTNTWVNEFCEWVESKRNRTIKVKLHGYDSWNVDSTIAIIALPLLKQFRDNKQAFSSVDLEDLPPHLQRTTTEEYDDQMTFDFYRIPDVYAADIMEEQWKWVLDEIIWAFEQLQPDCNWQEQYWITHPKMDMKKYPEDEGLTVIPVRWEIKGECDTKGMMDHQSRITNGLKLFGKYYQGLWD